jgi:hypothetical protein
MFLLSYVYKVGAVSEIEGWLPYELDIYQTMLAEWEKERAQKRRQQGS